MTKEDAVEVIRKSLNDIERLCCHFEIPFLWMADYGDVINTKGNCIGETSKELMEAMQRSLYEIVTTDTRSNYGNSDS